MKNKLLLIIMLSLTMLSLSACSVTDKEIIEPTVDYYNENTCKLTQQCEAGCNAVEKERSMFCDYACMEKKYCDPSNK